MIKVMRNMLKLVQAKNVEAEEVEALVKGGYSDVLNNWTIDCEHDLSDVEVVGTELVDTVMWMGSSSGETRCYTHSMVEVARDADGGLWVTEEQENYYFL